MAGIGFSLKKLFARKGVFGLCRAYGYAGLICAGPMILGVLLLVGVAGVAALAGMGEHERQLMNSLLTYALLAALTVTSFFNMINTRYVSDMLYEEKPELIMPSFHGCLLVMMPIGALLWAVFLFFSGTALVNRILCFWFFCVLMVVWTEMNYLNALKDYKALVCDFAASLATGLVLSLILLLLHAVNLVTLFGSVICAYGLLMALYYRRLLKYFPRSQGSPFRYLRWFDKCGSLAIIGLCVNIGLFAHLVIMYFGPLAEQAEGLFYSAPMHDVAALCAFFSILITTVNFVTSVETNFFPRYHTYYSLYNDGGSIRDIDQAEDEMLTVLRRELNYNGLKQLFCTLLFVVLGSIVLQQLPLGFGETSLSIFRFLCVGYALYALSNTQMLVLLYYEDHRGALWGSVAFAVIAVVGTILQITFSPTEIYGLGFTAGSIAFYLITWARLEWYTRKLPYFLLGRQALVPHDEHGPFSRLCDWIEEHEHLEEAQTA